MKKLLYLLYNLTLLAVLIQVDIYGMDRQHSQTPIPEWPDWNVSNLDNYNFGERDFMPLYPGLQRQHLSAYDLALKYINKLFNKFNVADLRKLLNYYDQVEDEQKKEELISLIQSTVYAYNDNSPEFVAYSDELKHFYKQKINKEENKIAQLRMQLQSIESKSNKIDFKNQELTEEIENAKKYQASILKEKDVLEQQLAIIVKENNELNQKLADRSYGSKLSDQSQRQEDMVSPEELNKQLEIKKKNILQEIKALKDELLSRK